jgi:hypothetical protein
MTVTSKYRFVMRHPIPRDSIDAIPNRRIKELTIGSAIGPNRDDDSVTDRDVHHETHSAVAAEHNRVIDPVPTKLETLPLKNNTGRPTAINITHAALTATTTGTRRGRDGD